MQNSSSAFIKTMARIGLMSKGLVYILLGSLTLLASMNMGGDESDKQDVFKLIFKQPAGEVLLIALIIGLCAYVFWRFIQAIKDTENKGNDKTALLNRVGYAFSGILYTTITFSAIKLLINHRSEKNNSGKQISEILQIPFGKWLVIIFAMIVIGRGIYQIYIAYSGKLEKRINGDSVHGKKRKIALLAGKFGYTSRGIVLGIIGYFILLAALHSNPNEAQDTKGTFHFIENHQNGKIILCIIAAGLAVYGAFMFIEARYRKINS